MAYQITYWLAWGLILLEVGAALAATGPRAVRNPGRTQRLITVGEWAGRLFMLDTAVRIGFGVHDHESASHLTQLIILLAVMVVLSQGAYRWMITKYNAYVWDHTLKES